MAETKIKSDLENQFEELMDKAKEVYPDIENSISTFSNMTTATAAYSRFEELKTSIQLSSTSNQIL